MKKKYQSFFIQNLMVNNKYSPIELDGKGEIPNVWCAHRVEFNREIFLILLNNENINYKNNYKNIILSNTRHNGTEVQITYVLTADKGEEYWRNLLANDYEISDNLVVIDSFNNSILLNRILDTEILEDIEESMRRIQLNSRKFDKNSNGTKVTMFIIVVNILVYLISSAKSGNLISSDSGVLLGMGANINYKLTLQDGKIYRLFNCMFLHGGIMHLGVNMYSLYVLGPAVEKIYGQKKFLLIYFISGIFSSVLSSIFLPYIPIPKGVPITSEFAGLIPSSVGASGAIVGLLGATLVFAFNKRKVIGKQFLMNILSVIAVNAVIGLTLPNIDNFGHLGGLVGGMVMALIFTKKSTVKN